MLGFAGNVEFAYTVLSQIVALDENHAIELPESPRERFVMIKNIIEDRFASLPRNLDLGDEMSIVYATRQGKGMALSFHVFGAEWSKKTGWKSVLHDVPASESGVVCAYGTGQANAKEAVEAWMREDAGRTSRSVFSGFCDGVGSGKDPCSGGPPQLMGMYRVGPAQEIGVIWSGKRFLAGIEAPPPPVASSLQWRNRLFERCDPLTMERLKDAQPHARPKRLLLEAGNG